MMRTRSQFARELAKLDLSHVDRAVAFLYYYSISQEFEERSVSELAGDLSDESFPRPNVTRLRQDLRQSRYTIRGKRPDTFRIDVRRLAELENQYAGLMQRAPIPQSDAIIPTSMVARTRPYLERLAAQMNVCYDAGLYDACAVLCRRLMESLILETYVSKGRHAEIQHNGAFFSLDRLIGFICSDHAFPLNRNTPRTMADIKQVGDTAAHDRVYITQQRDLDDVKLRYRRMIDELLQLAGVRR